MRCCSIHTCEVSVHSQCFKLGTKWIFCNFCSILVILFSLAFSCSGKHRGLTFKSCYSENTIIKGQHLNILPLGGTWASQSSGSPWAAKTWSQEGGGLGTGGAATAWVGKGKVWIWAEHVGDWWGWGSSQHGLTICPSSTLLPAMPGLSCKDTMGWRSAMGCNLVWNWKAKETAQQLRAFFLCR